MEKKNENFVDHDKKTLILKIMNDDLQYFRFFFLTGKFVISGAFRRKRALLFEFRENDLVFTFRLLFWLRLICFKNQRKVHFLLSHWVLCFQRKNKRSFINSQNKSSLKVLNNFTHRTVLVNTEDTFCFYLSHFIFCSFVFLFTRSKKAPLIVS